MSGKTLVIGATGTTGSRTVDQLVAAGNQVRAASRSASPVPGAEPVRFDWYRPDTHPAALDGIDRVYLLPPLGDTEPQEVMLPFLQHAQERGVRRVVLLSSSAVPEGGPATGMVHQALPDLFEQWAVLRPSWFMQNVTGTHYHAVSIQEHGSIWTATDNGRVGFVDAEDIAAVASHALTDEFAPNTDLVLTGPEALSYSDLAAILSEVRGRPVVHRRLSYQQLCDRLENLMPRDFATLLAGMDVAIASGVEDRTTDTVLRITGREPRSFRSFLTREMAENRHPLTT